MIKYTGLIKYILQLQATVEVFATRYIIVTACFALTH